MTQEMERGLLELFLRGTEWSRTKNQQRLSETLLGLESCVDSLSTELEPDNPL